jgi:hypothetical protein
MITCLELLPLVLKETSTRPELHEFVEYEMVEDLQALLAEDLSESYQQQIARWVLLEIKDAMGDERWDALMLELDDALTLESGSVIMLTEGTRI